MMHSISHRGLEPLLILTHAGHTQDDADQPATAVDSEFEGNEKPKPDSEERSQ
jgi:hypothetical protein